MESMVRYRHLVSDNARWEGFAFRDGDIIISTPAKCGTTWTQMICALLIFQTPDLPDALDQLSPWFDMQLRSPEDVTAALDAQTHRRFIKTHTPLDGLPWDERVTYITVGRDPRDVARSWDNHLENLNIAEFISQRQAAVGLEDLAELMPADAMNERPQTELERVRVWIDNDEVFGGMRAMLHHLDTFWQRRDEPNVVLLHYAALKADLEGEMRKLAGRLGIDVDEDRWPALVDAASFESMRSRATTSAPNATAPIWNDTTRFFNRGTSGQWRDFFDDALLAHHTERARSMVSADLYDWVHAS